MHGCIAGPSTQNPWVCSVVLQAEYLRSLNHQGQAEGVVSIFESNRVVYNSETLGEYVKALARLDRLDNSRVFNLVQVR